jgi:serine/threonine-protein kinase RIO1
MMEERKKKMKEEFNKLSPITQKALLDTLKEMIKPEKLKEMGKDLEDGKKFIINNFGKKTDTL